jgi:hypothetical protein
MTLATAAGMQALSSTSSVRLSPLLLSIAGRVGHAFEVQTMIAGFACHARGGELSAFDGKSAHAIVKSKRAHTVDFRISNGKLLVKCTCPAESMGVHPCKHTWAALLEIDKQGGLAELRTKRGALVLERIVEAVETKPAQAKKKSAAKKKARR